MKDGPQKQLIKAYEAMHYHFDAIDAAQRLAEPWRNLQRLQESMLGPGHLVDEVLKQKRAIRAVLGPIEGLWHHGILGIDTPGQRAAEHMAQLISGYEQRFRLPEIDELSQLTRRLADCGVMSAIAEHQERMAEFQRMIGALRTPWLDMQDELKSLTAFAELQTIGEGLKSLPPFGNEFTTILREDLGDWRTVVELPEGIIEDAVTRLDFYRSLGFQDALTDFPAAAFDQSLNVAGLRFPSLPSVLPAYKSERDTEPEEDGDAGFARNRKAYDLLLRFETQIRHFIDMTMKTSFGPKWVKQRVPGIVHQAWKEKKQAATDNGEPEKPLIAYADFTDYIRIIERNDNWRDVFQPIFGHRESVQESFRRLHPIRLCTMHSRIITLDDELFLEAETRRILKAIGVIR